MESANIADILNKKRLGKRISPPVRKKVFGIETCAQRFIGIILVSFIKIVVLKKELTVNIYEISKEIKPTVISIQLGDETLWEYPRGSTEDLDCRTILHYDQEYLLMILKDEKIKEIILVADLVEKHFSTGM